MHHTTTSRYLATPLRPPPLHRAPLAAARAAGLMNRSVRRHLVAASGVAMGCGQTDHVAPAEGLRVSDRSSCSVYQRAIEAGLRGVVWAFKGTAWDQLGPQ